MKLQDKSERRRFLSPDEARSLLQRIYSMQEGGGETLVRINSVWTGNTRWGRNRVVSTGDLESTRVSIGREMHPLLPPAFISANKLDDDSLREIVLRAEAIHEFETPNPDIYEDPPHKYYPYAEPDIWHDSSYNLGPEGRARIVTDLIKRAKSAGLTGAGYLAVGATARAVGDSVDLFRYYPYTTSELTMTVRDPKRGGSGWAGVDWDDWDRIDADKLYGIAEDKCIKSINPVAIEPGRYTTILEPQAVCDLWLPLIPKLDRHKAEMGPGAFGLKQGLSKIGLKVMDERITVSTDPMDPDIGYPPFDWNGHSYQNVNWIENGVVKNLAYKRQFSIYRLGHDKPLPLSGAFRISGGDTSIDEMIESTERGVMVTRFSSIRLVYDPSVLLSGFTRDGLWLIEKGKISKAIKNFRFVDSPMFVFNNIVQLGPPQRVYSPNAPAICPPVKSNDFAFTALVDAV